MNNTPSVLTKTSIYVDVQINRSLNINHWELSEKPTTDEIRQQKLNTIDKWVTVKNATVEQLAEIVSTGDAVRGAIKIDGNLKVDIESVHFLCMDFDDPNWTIADTLASELIDSACIFYHSPSYTKENQKHRIIFALSKSVDVVTAELILKHYLHVEYLLADKSCIDAGRFYYGSRNKATVLSNDAVLDVDIALAIATKNLELKKVAKVSLPTSTQESPNKQTYSEKLLDYLHDELFIKKFNGNCLDLYTQHFPDGCTASDYKPRALELDEIERYEIRYNVFNPEPYADQGGFKALVSYSKGKLPFLLDHTPRTLSVTNRPIATFADYWLQWQSRIDKALAKRYQECRDKTGRFRYGVFDSLVYDICEFYDIPQYKLPDPYEILSMLMVSERDSVFKIANTGDFTKFQVKVFYDHIKFFEDATSLCYITYRLVKKIESAYPDFIDIVNADIGRYNKESGRLPKKFLREDQIDSWLTSKRCLRIIHDTIDTITEFFEVPHLVPIGDKLFNVLTKETLPNNGQGKNTGKPYPISVIPGGISDDHPVIKVLKKFYHEWSANEVKGDVLLSWLILCVCRQAYKTRRGLLMAGRTQLGKSGYCQTVTDIMNYGGVNASRSVTQNDFFGSTNNHKSENLYGSYFSWVDEANDVPHSDFINAVKLYMQGEKGRMFVNPKGKKGFTSKIVFGVAFTVQDELKSRTDEATDGRIIQIFIGDDTVKNEVDYKLLDDNKEIILSWCLSQDIDFHINRLETLSKHQIFKDALREQKKDVDLVYDFLTSNFIEITYAPSDRVEKKALFAAFNLYVATEQVSEHNTFTHVKGFIKSVGKTLLHGQGLWDQMFNPEWLKYNSNGVGYIKGIKLKTKEEQKAILDFVKT